MERMVSIYVHIPFCEKKCDYCDFCSNPLWLNKSNEYIDKIKEELIIQNKLVGQDFVAPTIFIGGGTPSLLNVGIIENLLRFIKENFCVAKDCEITIECNPRSFTSEKLKGFLKAGINRISIGVQSLNDATLNAIGRKQTRLDALNMLEIIKVNGFSNFNIDYIIGLPKQTQNDVFDDINVILSYNPAHFSMYSLILEENTALYKNKSKFIFMNDDELVDTYDKACLLLAEKDLHRYEISNFSKSGHECMHNKRYWNVGEYIGVGISAHSYFNGIRTANNCDFESYLNTTDFTKIKSQEVLNNTQKINEYIMLGLRKVEGFSLAYLKEELFFDLLKEKDAELKALKQFFAIKNERLFILPQYFNVSNFIIEKLTI